METRVGETDWRTIGITSAHRLCFAQIEGFTVDRRYGLAFSGCRFATRHFVEFDLR